MDPQAIVLEEGPWRLAFPSRASWYLSEGLLIRPADDLAKAEPWDACNNLVIPWIMNNVFDIIARSILFVKTAAEIWSQLEK